MNFNFGHLWVIFGQNTKAIANMEVTARVLFTLAMVYFVLQWSVTENIRNDGSGFNIVTVRCGSKFGRRYPSGKAWRKFILSKFYRKRCCRRPTGLVTSAIVVSSTEMEPFLSLLLSGDVELNPGPTNSSKSSRSANKEGNLDFGEIFLRLEEKFDSGQESILRNQTQIMNRLSSLESQMEKFKEEIDDLRTQTTNLKSTINSLSESVGNNYDHGKDLQFLVDRQEQYSRKNSIRITGVTEETGESIENKTISILKKEIDVDISSEEIEIVHRVGRVHNGNPRSILVKFLSHKTKESVMRRKKNARNVKIYEDLAPGIKMIFNEVSKNRRLLNVDSVWTIDGKIKYRFTNNPRTFEIRSYSDYHCLFNARQ